MCSLLVLLSIWEIIIGKAILRFFSFSWVHLEENITLRCYSSFIFLISPKRQEQKYLLRFVRFYFVLAVDFIMFTPFNWFAKWMFRAPAFLVQMFSSILRKRYLILKKTKLNSASVSHILSLCMELSCQLESESTGERAKTKVILCTRMSRVS